LITYYIRSCDSSQNSCWVLRMLHTKYTHKSSTSNCQNSFYYHIIVILGVYCDIYKSSYNVSRLNSPHPSFSFIPSPHSWNRFNRSHFSIFINEYIIFLLHSPSSTLFLISLRTKFNSEQHTSFHL
jgi:hypothetical protein